MITLPIHKTISTIVGILLLIGTFLYILYLTHSDYSKFANDIDGHIDYIKYIVLHNALPNPSACRECYHPPLYYAMAAVAYASAESLGLNAITAVRCLSLVCYLVFIYYSLKLLSEWIEWRPAYLTAVCLVIFWPLGVTKATLINNDTPLFMAEIVGFFYFMRWWQQQNIRYLTIAVWWCGIAMAIKTSGVLLGVVMACLISYRCLLCPRILRTFSHGALLLALSMAVLFAVFGPAQNYYYHQQTTRSIATIIDPVTLSELGSSYAIHNDSPYYYMTFDYQTYLNEPFFITSNVQTGRDYFWNTVLKSALFAEYKWKSPTLALALAQAELAMLVYMLVALCFAAYKRQHYTWLPFLVFIIIHISGLMVFRALTSLASAQDYRYIYACTPVLALLYAKAIDCYYLFGKTIMVYLGITMAVTFAGMATAMIISEVL